MHSSEVELRVEAIEALERHNEPVTCGIPWPRGVLADASSLRLCDETGQQVALQTRTLDRWPDGSVRWLLLDWQTSPSAGKSYWLRLAALTEAPAPPVTPLLISEKEEQGANERGNFFRNKRVIIDTSVMRFELLDQSHGPFLLQCHPAGGSTQPLQASFNAEDAQGHRYEWLSIRSQEIEECGPLRAALRMSGSLLGGPGGGRESIQFVARLHFFAGSPTVRFVVTIRNPRKAEHPGGHWDLGNDGSIYLKDVSFALKIPSGPEQASVRFSPEAGAGFETGVPPLEIYQDSSGGPNWRGSNHINRHRVVSNTFCGYRLRIAGNERTRRRATPVVALTRGENTIALAMPAFWQNFPKAVEASENTLTLQLFPSHYADVHELQGGEQKTHEFYAAFGPDRVTAEPLGWARSPLHAHATPEWYCAAGVVPYLTPRATDPNAEYLRLVDAAIEGDDTFEHKREVIDEYGWRHFGDIYGDHEAVFHKGPTPLVSHYNNQYDAIAGFACQFLRSGDFRWFRHMDELAAHVIDIDIYHTDHDKAAYNHGLFWHTFHYVDADTGTHRSYPKAAKVCGGGPANEHNYTTGLLLHYFLTGNQASREAALELARWVVDMDDGKKTVFRWLAGGYTGLASSSRTPTYHGPGRGAGNSIAVLLDGHRLSGGAGFLAKVEQLIRRCIHPADNITARNLLDAENRWFYIMFLQTLGRYLDFKAELGELDACYAYARASLLHYARWMADHEYPYLNKPELLEYPTETWVAQDMRKSEVFMYAARHAAGEERGRFLERSEFFYRYSIGTLAGMKTRTLARPVVLLLSFGFMHTWFGQHLLEPAPAPAEEHQDFGQPMTFVPQKVRALRRLKALVAASALAAVLGAVYLMSLLLR